MKTKILGLGLICLFFISCVGSQLHNRKIMRQNYIKDHSEISSQVKDAILNGDVLIGMTAKQVVASRGRPYKINRSTGSYGVHEQWVMVTFTPGVIGGYGLDKKAKKYAYIYFENGKVTSWQSR